MAPKTYFSHDNDSTERKQGAKGIPKYEELFIEDYKNALFTHNSHHIKLRSLRMKNGKMCRTEITKRGLSDIFVKYRVQDDQITCLPLTKNGEIL